MTTQTQKLADEFNRYFTSANDVDVSARVSVSRDEWRELYALIKVRGEPATIEDNSQNWAGMDGAIAWHLIERHAEGWGDIGKMMDEWLKANAPRILNPPTK